MRTGAVLALAIVPFFSGVARAEETEPVRLAFKGPPECLDAEAFVKEVRARTTRFTLVESGDGTRSFNVRILAVGHHFLGDVMVADRKGDVSIRSVPGTDCDDVTHTLAFITAISIDPKASSTPAPQPTPNQPPTAALEQQPVSPPTVVPPASPAQSPPAAPGPASPPLPPTITFGPPAGELPAATESPHRPVEQAPRPWHATAGLGASAQALAAPGAVFGDSLFLAFALDTRQLIAPEVRVAASRASSGTLDAVQGSATLAWTLGHVDVCPVRLPARGSIDVRPCVAGEAGALSASAAGIPHSESHVRPWGEVGALARLEWLPIDPLMLDAEISLSAPVAREHFYVAPTDVVYQAPVLIASGGVAVGVRFP